MMKISCFLIACVALFLTSKAVSLDSDEYYVSEFNLTFLQAWTECKIMNKNLINLEDEESYKNLVEYLKSGGYSETNSYWLGGVGTTNGLWVWLESLESIAYSKWATNEPVSKGKTDHCLLLGRDYGNVDPYEWQSQNCTEERYFICQ